MARRLGVRLALFVAAGMLIGFATAFVNPVYVSRATLVVRRTSGDAGELVDEACQVILSRRSLRSIIDEHQLYRAELDRVPYEDVFEIMRSSTSFEHVPQAGGPKQVRVAFHHPDRATAAKITYELTQRIAASSPALEIASAQAGLIRVHETAPVPAGARGELRRMLSRLEERIRMEDGTWPEELHISYAGNDGTLVQTNLAKAVQRLVSTEKFEQVFAPQGLAIGLLEPASLPERPEGLGRTARAAIGALGGLLAGLLLAWSGRPRGRVLPSLF